MSLLVRELAFIPVSGLGMIFAARAAFHKDADFQSRQAWFLISLSLGVWMIADGFWAYYIIVQEESPFPSIADVFYLSNAFLLLVGIFRFPAPELPRNERTHYLIDLSIILIAMGSLVGYYIVGPERLLQANASVESLLLIAYPLTDLILVFALFSVLVRRPQAGTVGVLSFLGAGILLVTVANIVWAFQEARGEYMSGAFIYAAWMSGYALIVVSPQRHVDVLKRNLRHTVPGRKAARLRALIPYVAVAATGIVVTIAGLPELITRFGVVAILMLMLLILFLIRQFMTLRENARLLVDEVRRESDERLSVLVEHASDVITVLDQDLRIRFQSPSSGDVLGRKPESFIGTRLIDWLHDEDRDCATAAIDRAITHESRNEKFEWRVAIPGQPDVHLETVVSNELDNPLLNGLVLNSRDITERKQLEKELTYQAYHDALTGLPNRASFLRALVSSMDQVREDNALALMFLDLDYFKLMNDTMGHEAGDALLNKVGKRLSDSLRPGDTLGRLAGDEFTVLLPGLRDRDEGIRVAERMLRRLQEPMEIAGEFRQISTSIGLAFTQSSQTAPEDLLRQADSAMYAAKRNGRDRIESFEPWMDGELVALDRDRREAEPVTIPGDDY